MNLQSKQRTSILRRILASRIWPWATFSTFLQFSAGRLDLLGGINAAICCFHTTLQGFSLQARPTPLLMEFALASSVCSLLMALVPHQRRGWAQVGPSLASGYWWQLFWKVRKKLLTHRWGTGLSRPFQIPKSPSIKLQCHWFLQRGIQAVGYWSNAGTIILVILTQRDGHFSSYRKIHLATLWQFLSCSSFQWPTV